VVAKDAFEAKAEPQGGAARRGVERIAFPLVAAVAERLEGIAGQQILRLGGERRALKKTNGSTDGTALVDAMKGLAFASPRGPVTIDPETREMIQNIYIRKVERVGGELYNVEFVTVPSFKDPSKAK